MDRLTGNRAGPGLALVCVAQFVVVLDATIVVTALPAVSVSLGFPTGDLPWVITAYTLVFGGFLIPGGRLADLVGPRRVFLLGLVGFALGSVGCGLAWSPAALIGARVVQGLGAALLSPAALALLSLLSAPGAARHRAVGWWTATAAGGGASGWVLGGVLTQYLGWRSVFWVNLPIGLLTFALTLRVLPAGRRLPGRQLDLGGAVGVTAALGLLGFGLTSIGERGVAAPASWAPILAAVAVTAVVVRHERTGVDPLVPPQLLRSRTVAGAVLTALALTATTTPAMYLCTLYVQQDLHLSPARAGLLFPVFNLAVIGGSLGAPAVLLRFGARPTLLAGFAVIGAGLGPLVLLREPTAITQLLAAFALLGLGLGAASVASTQTGTEAADPAQQGVVAGVLNAAAQVGTALGLALTPVVVAAGGGGYRPGFIGTLVVASAGLLASLLVPRSRPAPPRPLEPVPGSAPESGRTSP